MSSVAAAKEKDLRPGSCAGRFVSIKSPRDMAMRIPNCPVSWQKGEYNITTWLQRIWLVTAWRISRISPWRESNSHIYISFLACSLTMKMTYSMGPQHLDENASLAKSCAAWCLVLVMARTPTQKVLTSWRTLLLSWGWYDRHQCCC